MYLSIKTTHNAVQATTVLATTTQSGLCLLDTYWLQFTDTHAAYWLFLTSYTKMSAWCLYWPEAPPLPVISPPLHRRAAAQPWWIIEVPQVKHDRGDSALFIPHTKSFSLQTPRDTVTTHCGVTTVIGIKPDFQIRTARWPSRQISQVISEQTVRGLFLCSESRSLLSYLSAERAVEQIIFQNEMYQCSNTEEESHQTITDSNWTICCSARSSESGTTRKNHTTHVYLLYNSSS